MRQSRWAPGSNCGQGSLFLSLIRRAESVLHWNLAPGVDTFSAWIRAIDPEWVYIGFNSKPDKVKIPEPSEGKVQELVDGLSNDGIKIHGKTLRGVTIPTSDSNGSTANEGTD